MALPAGYPLLALLLSVLMACLSPNSTAEMSREEEARVQLAELREQIAQIQANMTLREGEKDALQARLEAAEKAINALDQRLREIEGAIAAELPVLEQLDAERVSLQADLTQQQASMSRDIRALWALQRGGGLRVLFGDQSANEIALNLAYFERLLEQRDAAIEAFRTLLVKVDDNAAALRESQAKLARQSEALEKERREAAALQEERRVALAAIERSLGDDAAQIARLEADQTRLTSLLQELQRSLAEMDTPVSYKPFAQARGEMVFPTVGRPSNRYGGTRNRGDMRWRGWIIPAPEGSDVRAVHHGRVVYADWLRGQGLLIIIDHGDGFLSLYGQNRSLQRDVGDWVTPGQVIAKVGASGGAERTALYFEIRNQGEPVDPGRWVKR